MMSSEPQPRRTAEKRRFSSTAVQAIHQRRRWAVARVGAMARRGEARRGAAAWLRLGLRLCSRLRTDLGVSARHYAAGSANPGRCRSAWSLSPLCGPGGKCAQQGSPSPARALGHPLRRWLVRLPAAPGEPPRPDRETSPSVHSEGN